MKAGFFHHMGKKGIFMYNDTIAAVATALSDSGIGIIRISGPKAVEVADCVFEAAGKKEKLKDFDSHTIHYGYIKENGTILDEVMVSLMKAPRSYTKEDTVEISCHGGVYLLRRVLDLVLKNGARLADPGEFTKRAFLNGRIDLTQAEAVMDLISSENEFVMRSSISQLKGSVQREISQLREKILSEMAFIESALDDPEHISMEGYPPRLSAVTDELIRRMEKLLHTFEEGRVRKEGIKTVIVGKPNAGKSSLLNLLTGEERAIVTAVPGTTRDILEEKVRLNGIDLLVVDTAGIRESEDAVERIGVERAKQYAANADLIVYVVDSSSSMDENDEEILNMIADKKVIVLSNKKDLPSVLREEDLKKALEKKLSGVRIINTSMKEGKGMEEFEDAIRDMFLNGQIDVENEVVITSLRHAKALKEAKESLEMVKKSIEDKMPEDFYSIDLMNAYSLLGSIIGEETGEDLVNEIFSKFCMGK